MIGRQAPSTITIRLYRRKTIETAQQRITRGNDEHPGIEGVSSAVNISLDTRIFPVDTAQQSRN